MALLNDYGYTWVMKETDLTHETDDFYSRVVPIHSYTQIVLTYDATIGLTGGSTPGVKFTLEADVSGEGEWVVVTTLQTTNNGYAGAAPTDPTITTTGKEYRYYGYLLGMNLRVKAEITGTPTGGTATINGIYLVAE